MTLANLILGIQVTLGVAMIVVLGVSRFGSDQFKHRLANFYHSHLSHRT